jgi:polysaccharide chain length determinant protein (PEP-CTERM system associated)
MSSAAFDPKRLLHTAKTTKRFWVPLFVVVIAAVNGAMVFMPKKYQSSAQVLIHEPKLNMIVGQMGVSINDRLPTIREEMTSFRFLSQVARKLNLGRGLDPEAPQYQSMIESIRGNIDLRVKNRDLFTIVYQDSTPERARDITAEIVNQYIAASSRTFEKKTGETLEFITKELEVAQREMRMAQDAVTKYKQEHPNEIPDVQAQQITRLNRLRGDKLTEEGRLQGLKSSLDLQQGKLKNTPAEIVSQSTVQESQELATLKRNKKNLEAQLQLLLSDYTEEHWKVKELRAQLKQMDEQLATETNSPTKTETKAPNPAYQILVDQVTQTEVAIRQSQSNIDKMAQEIKQLETWQGSVPRRQQELDSLNITMENYRERVNMLGKRLNEAQTASNVEEQGQGPSFELSDPPRLQPAPVAPNPKKFAVLSIAMASALSGAVIYLLMLLDSAVRSVEEARRMLQMPVLGVVQRVVTASETLRQARRRKLRNVGFSLGALVLVGVVILSMTVLREPLQHQVQTIRNLLSK